MIWKVVLAITALLPFLSLVLGLPGPSSLSFRQGIAWTLLYGIGWVLLYLFVYEHAPDREQKRQLLLFAPLALFTFSPL